MHTEDPYRSSVRCLCGPGEDQLTLFDLPEPIDVAYRPRVGTDRITTSALAHEGFDYAACRSVFGDRSGIGPLIICPDTSVLIDLLDGGDAIDALAMGIVDDGPLAFGPILSGNWSVRRDAVDDLMRLWFWRDIRFFVSDIYLEDSNKPLAQDRLQQRKRVMQAFAQDIWARGGFDVFADEVEEEDAVRCPFHGRVLSDRVSRHVAYLEHRRWPTGTRDALLLREAIEVGAHVFLTEDHGILACAATGRAHGTEILRPGDLLHMLDRAGEIDIGERQLMPDMISMSRYYEMFGTDE